MATLGFLSHSKKSALGFVPPSAESQHNYGLHTIVGKDWRTAGVTDIVAIHGVNGHYEKSWTDDVSQYNWLRDRLSNPSRSTMLRVLSFAYNSKIQSSSSTASIRDFATQLLECLLVERESEEEQHRPMVFICHSLGGIVFKLAFTIAHSEDRYEGLAKKMKGVLFFGTPHRGSGWANLGGVIGNLFKASGLGKHANLQLLKDLEVQSQVLEQTSNSFLQLGSSLQVVSFYEVQKMANMSSLIVEKSSAVTDMSGEIAMALNRDHRNLCKFSSGLDKTLEVVISNLMRIINSTSRGDRRQERQLEIGDLATSNPDLHRARNPPPVPGTCTWILHHDKFTRWLTSTSPGLLWLSADPGCGKSVLASFLIDYFGRQFSSTQDQDVTICYFFFKNDDVEQHEGIYGSQAILHQILQSQPTLLGTAGETISPQNLGDIHSVWHTIKEVLRDPQANDTICVLDGFDECEPVSRRIITEKLLSIFSPKSLTATRPNKFRMLVSSRPDNALKVAFDRPSNNTRQSSYSTIRLRGEDETDSISRDVNLVINNEIAEIEAMGLPAELLEEVQRELVLRADRTFLWVTLMIQLIRERAEAGASRRELRAILQSRDIDSVYAGILAGRSYGWKARKLLSIVLGATRPLSIVELSIALAIKPEVDCLDPGGQRRPGEYSFTDVEDSLVYPFDNHIVALCGNFVRIIRDKVYLVHETAREFLLNGSFKDRHVHTDDTFIHDDDGAFLDLDGITLQDDTENASSTDSVATQSWKSSLTLSQCHAVCLGVCVTYIYCMGKETLGHKLGEPSPRTAPFLSYAGSQWARHFREVRDTIDSRQLPYYYNICHPRFPGFETWIEAYSTILSDRHLLNLDGADDDKQDSVISMLKLEREEARQAAGPGRFIDIGQYSTNPGSLANHHFPLSVSSKGWVSLDLNMPEYNDITKNPW